VLSEPQLFIEGNHRTGALIMSWLLAREGKPPFVLSVDNAKAYFDPSSIAKSLRKHSLRMMLSRPKLLKRFAALLKNGAQSAHQIL
jgi:Fic family protein